MISIGREVTYAKEMRVAAGWPDHLGELKAGDKVGLQVLYSPAMARQIPPKNMFARALGALGRQEPGAAPVPLLSNRIEFTVTDDLLRARAAQQKAE
jgi:hypothetical protein